MIHEQSARLDDLDRRWQSEAVEVLVRAFAGDPLMHYLFDAHPAGREAALRELFTFSCAVRFELGWPLIGAFRDGQLAGVLGVSAPDEPAWPESLSRVYARLTEEIGPVATGRLERYAKLTDQARPVSPHFGVGMIGVLPECQGEGIGRLLLERIHALADGHPTARGVYLDTEHDVNVPFYERLGYEVVAAPRLDDRITVWCMFRPNERPELGERPAGRTGATGS